MSGFDFEGGSNVNLDSKGRIVIPQDVRALLMATCKGRLVITAHTDDRCLLIYPEPEWHRLLPKIKQLPNRDPKAQKMQRLLLGYRSPVELDGETGRISIEKKLRTYAGLEKGCMLVGMLNRFELWSDERWFEYIDRDIDVDEMLPAVAEFEL